MTLILIMIIDVIHWFVQEVFREKLFVFFVIVDWVSLQYDFSQSDLNQRPKRNTQNIQTVLVQLQTIMSTN